MDDQDLKTTPGYRAHYNVNPELEASNQLDDEANPTGGDVRLANPDADKFPSLYIEWQNGPRTPGEDQAPDELAPPNGAFVEDVLWAALQRLEFFNTSKYRCRENSIAITKIEEALFVLKDRQLSRSDRGVEGKHEV